MSTHEFDHWTRFNVLVLDIHGTETPEELISVLHRSLPELFGRACEIFADDGAPAPSVHRECRLGPFGVRFDTCPEEGEIQTLGLLGDHVALARRRFRRDGPFAPGRLTPRQAEVLPLIVKGFSNAEIAGELGISARTAEKHAAAILRHFRLPARSRLIALFGAMGSPRTDGGASPHVSGKSGGPPHPTG